MIIAFLTGFFPKTLSVAVTLFLALFTISAIIVFTVSTSGPMQHATSAEALSGIVFSFWLDVFIFSAARIVRLLIWPPKSQ